MPMSRKRALVAVVTVVLSTSAGRADQEGCTVLLCISNPAGWAAVSDCVPPVKAWMRQRAKGAGMPNCGEGGMASNVETRVIGSTVNSEGVEIPILKSVIVIRNSRGETVYEGDSR
jgi:hypothetical protein